MKFDFFASGAASLRGQLLRWLIPPVLAVVLISSMASYSLALKFANDAYDTSLFDTARSLAQQVHFEAGDKPVLNLPRAAREILESDPYDHIYYRVVTPAGETLTGRPDLPAPSEPLTARRPVQFYDGHVAGEPVRIGAYGVFRDAAGPQVIVICGETLVKRNRLSNSLLITLLLPLVTLTFVVAAVVGFGIRRALAPLRELADALSRRGWHNLRTVGSAGVPVEVSPLTEGIDDLMGRLRNAQAAQQRFILEAAHQLRTPLAGLSSQTERALLAADIEHIKLALTQLQTSARRVTRLVNQLLAMARADPENGVAHDMVTLDVSALAQEVCMEWVPEALRTGVDLGYAGEAGAVTVTGNDALLRELLTNLIDNALRYAAHAGGSITVRVARTPAVTLSVEDDGPGIPENERERIFERFHRLPGSPAGGCGLGLAIVAEIAHAHRARVYAEAGDGGRGTAFRLVFPEDCAPAGAADDTQTPMTRNTGIARSA